MTVSVKAPAKINLTLDVLGKRTDGYHEVEMVVTTIDLADRLELTLREDGRITLDCSASYVPTDERNHAYQAAKKMQEHFGVSAGVHIKLEKAIPVAAGLAGGSSDAAAVIKGLNRLWRLGLSTAEMAEIGAMIGSDVPFCIYGGTALARGRGEIVTPLPKIPPCWVVLAKPPIGVSTAEVYRRLNLEAIEKHPNNERMIRAIQASDFAGICRELGNVLENVTFEMHPEVRRMKEQMIRLGGTGVLMSGSGPTVFALVQKESKVHRIYNGLRGFCKDVYAVRTLG
ncbi:4-(cytidine 5'-diphospho)-2-C-methyl-D-erythritol kinase [Bacillaceae bacterium]